MEIRAYQENDEISWVRCRVLSFLDTAYFDNVLKEKEKYNNPAIELVAIEDEQVVGLLDVEYELEERTVCSGGEGLGGMIWHIAVHPDYRRRGIAGQLLYEAEKIAKEKSLNRLEAWTRDDNWVNQWYQKNGFQNVESYLHVYLEGRDEMKDVLKSEIPGLYPVHAFAHYVGEEKDTIRKRFKRVHECICYEKKLE
ncbi:GNAT family N-acetyltransferase [Bacillaceae bacterium CLA-AA-H227]|uniref:GNAT family N-acetyltransferase n=1 Tax=Robertmurraya yapensis (ex Hitch et al 2024) TaxID=3133160 RepID=A0ACC6SB42_9BACI